MMRVWCAAMKERGRRGSIAATLVLSVAATARCPICTPYPTTTRVDRLVDADIIALAREDQNRPFQFAALEVLRGAGTAPEIDLFVNSGVRRRLAVDENARVLVAHDPTDDEWRSIAIVDGATTPIYRNIVDDIILWGEEVDDVERLTLFADLLNAPQEDVFLLAYAEIARAPYSMIRTLGKNADLSRVRAVATELRWVEWRPLAILLLGTSPRAADVEQIDQRLRSAGRFRSSRDLAALATASIEQRGEAAIAFIETEYVDRARTPDELAAIMLALSTHGREGRVELRDRIRAIYPRLIAQSPHLAIPAAADLTAWSDWSCLDVMATALDALENDPEADVRPVLNYLRQAGRRSR